MMISRRVFPFLLLIYMAACTTAAGRRQAASVERTTLRVNNQSVLDMTVYVLKSSQRIRLGLAGGLNTTVMTIPPTVIFGSTPLRFQLDPIGSNRAPVTETISVSEGEEVEMTIPPR